MEARSIKNKKTTILGFTLIELLVVISIIAVLMSLLVVNIVDIRQRTRDGRRKADVRQIQSALEIYRADVGSYPAPNELYPIDEPDQSLCDQPLSTSETTYMEKVPCDPFTKDAYKYSSSSFSYTLTACLENTKDVEGEEDQEGLCGQMGRTDCSVTEGNCRIYQVKNP